LQNIYGTYKKTEPVLNEDSLRFLVAK